MRRRQHDPGAAGDDKFKGIAAVARRFKAFRPAAEVLKVVRAVPTRFIQLDHATRVGGLPVERFMLMHGESGEGKTAFLLGLLAAFLDRGDPVLHEDAERTTPITWARQMMGQVVDSPLYMANRPDTYEDTVAEVRNFLNTVSDAREAKEFGPDASALVAVDSLRKLVPADLMKEILKADAEGDSVKGGRDRRAQLQAKMNAAWMDELIPLLERAGAGFIAIAREMQDPDADMWAKKFGNDYKVGGGGAIYYDASLVMRVDRHGWVKEGDGKDQKVYGERHRVVIRKTKVGNKDDKVATFYFHTSNGTFIPPGFDRARDVLELAKRFGIIKAKGTWLTWGKHRWQGEHAAVRKLTADAESLALLEAETRAQFADHKPVEHDAETGEVG